MHARDMSEANGDAGSDEKNGEGRQGAPSPPPVAISFPTTHSSSSSSMSDLLHMIAERQGPAGEEAKGRRGGAEHRRPRVDAPVGGLLHLRAAARPAGRQRPQGRQVARSGDGSVGAASAAVVTSTPLEKLRRNVLRKRLDWQQMPSRYPLVQRLLVWRQRFAWSARFLPSSALPLPSGGSVTDTFVCNAPKCGSDDVAVLQREMAERWATGEALGEKGQKRLAKELAKYAKVHEEFVAKRRRGVAGGA
ncbi:hypothetical protein MOQ_008068, partial [Trypanosoma cruzi marinkellei]